MTTKVFCLNFSGFVGGRVKIPTILKTLSEKFILNSLRRVHRSYIAADADPMELLENRASLKAFVTNAAEQVASTFFELSTFDLLNRERS